MSQQYASVSQGWICSDNFTCCHTEIEAADQTFYFTKSQYTDTGPTSPSADSITPGTWQVNCWSANFKVNGMTKPGKIPSQAGFEPLIFHSWGAHINHEANEAVDIKQPTNKRAIGETKIHLLCIGKTVTKYRLKKNHQGRSLTASMNSISIKPNDCHTCISPFSPLGQGLMLAALRLREESLLRCRSSSTTYSGPVSSVACITHTHTHMHARMHAQTHICMHTHTHTCTRACTHERTYAHTHACAHARTYARTHTHTHTRTRACTHECTYARTHTHTHARAHTHMHAHIHTHSHTNTYTHAHTNTCTYTHTWTTGVTSVSGPSPSVTWKTLITKKSTNKLRH